MKYIANFNGHVYLVYSSCTMIIADYYIASLTFGEIAARDWLRSTFAESQVHYMSVSNQPEEPIVLTLENSVINAKKASQPTARITDIEQWTTAFSIYISVMTHQFPGRAQELLHYMSLIRHAAQTQPGLGWCIYDHKFRCKAALNPSLDWSAIDQQLWLMIFNISPDMLALQYRIFSHGPQNRAFSGGERGGLCNDFNRSGHCYRQACQYRHICNKCNDPHSGRACLSVNSKQVDDEKHSGKRIHKSSRSTRE